MCVIYSKFGKLYGHILNRWSLLTTRKVAFAKPDVWDGIFGSDEGNRGVCTVYSRLVLPLE